MIYFEVAAVLVAAIAVLAIDPILVPIAAFPATLLIQRLGGGAGDGLSFTDVFVILGFAVAFPKFRFAAARTLRRALVPVGVYLFAALLSVFAHPNIHDSLEWGHRIEMLVGSLVVGWVVGASGRARQAVTLFLIGCVVIAIGTLYSAVRLHFAPAQWGGYQKNLIGAVLWMAAIIAHINPPWINLNRRFAQVTKYLSAVGVLAAQSKQAIIALTFSVILAAILQPSVRRRSRLILAALTPVCIAGYLIFKSETKVATNFSTVGVRETSLSAALHVWSANPFFGQGMRWYYLPQFSGYIQPPNIAVEALTETGIIGTVALFYMLLGSSHRYWKLMPPAYATLAIVLVLGRAVEDIFDVYWVSGTSTLPWLVAGLAMGAWDLKQVRKARAGELTQVPPGPAEKQPVRYNLST